MNCIIRHPHNELNQLHVSTSEQTDQHQAEAEAELEKEAGHPEQRAVDVLEIKT